MSDNNNVERRSHSIELELVSVNHRLNTTEEILKEVKNVLVEQNKTIVEMVKLQEKQHIQERDLVGLKKDFANKNKITDPILDEFKTSSARITGIVAATTFFLCLLQGILGYAAMNALDRLDRIEQTLFFNKVQK